MLQRKAQIWVLFLVVGLVSLLTFGLPEVYAQTSRPARAAAACSPLTPCPPADAVASEVGGLSFSASAAAALASRSAQVEPKSSGFWLAWIVMALMGLALLYALVSAVLSAFGRAAPASPGAADILIPTLALVGMGVAIYLTVIEMRNAVAVCGPVGDCNAVQASPYAKLFGVVPVGLLGAVGYVLIIGAWLVGRFGSGGLAHLAPLAILGLALFGVLFSVYLTYLELFVILAVCMWCLSSAAIMAVILILAVGPSLAAIAGER